MRLMYLGCILHSHETTQVALPDANLTAFGQNLYGPGTRYVVRSQPNLLIFIDTVPVYSCVYFFGPSLAVKPAVRLVCKSRFRSLCLFVLNAVEIRELARGGTRVVVGSVGCEQYVYSDVLKPVFGMVSCSVTLSLSAQVQEDYNLGVVIVKELLPQQSLPAEENINRVLGFTLEDSHNRASKTNTSRGRTVQLWSPQSENDQDRLKMSAGKDSNTRTKTLAIWGKTKRIETSYYIEAKAPW